MNAPMYTARGWLAKRCLAAAGALLLLGSASADGAELVVRVVGVATHGQGKLSVRVYDSAGRWEAAKAPFLESSQYTRGRRMVEFHFAGLPPGRYGAMVLRDLDGNGKFDRGLFGIPKDGYGFSNNPRIMRKPRFDEIAVPVTESGGRIEVRMK